jgi:hypothetical protein
MGIKAIYRFDHHAGIYDISRVSESLVAFDQAAR